MGKWVFGVVLALALMLLLGTAVRKSVRAEIEVAATPEAVWQVITDPTSYGEWNPIFVAYEGTFAEGNTLTLQMKLGDDDPASVQVLVKHVQPNRWLHQGGGLPSILTYDHNWYLQPTQRGTRIMQYEYYTGLYVLFWDPTPAELGYKQANRNLKQKFDRSVSLEGHDE